MTKTATRAIRSSDLDVPVVWAEGMKPAVFPHSKGTLFFARGQVAWVKWEGGTDSPIPIARKALRVVQ